MELPGFQLMVAIVIALVGGWMRGVTGFGAAMVMTPPLSLILGPQLAVPVTLILETFAAAPMLPAAARIAKWRVLAPISVGAVVCVPIGTYLLIMAEPDTLRRAIALTVIVFSMLLLRGARYEGRQRPATALCLGGLSGAMLGATSIGGPPIILYLLAGSEPVHITRANLTLYIAVISAVGLLMLGVRGAIGVPVTLFACAMAPFFVLGVIVGARLFANLSDRRFRFLATAFMLVVSVVVLVA